MYVHEEVLAIAKQIAALRADWTFAPYEIVEALPLLKESSVRTHVVSRCCVNAPVNHLHKWDYFRRVGRGRYELRPKYRKAVASLGDTTRASAPPISGKQKRRGDGPPRRDVIHAVIHCDNQGCTAECLEVAVVTQGSTLDDVIQNLKEAVALHLEGEDLSSLGLADHPRLQITLDAALTA